MQGTERSLSALRARACDGGGSGSEARGTSIDCGAGSRWHACTASTHAGGFQLPHAKGLSRLQYVLSAAGYMSDAQAFSLHQRTALSRARMRLATAGGVRLVNTVAAGSDGERVGESGAAGSNGGHAGESVAAGSDGEHVRESGAAGSDGGHAGESGAAGSDGEHAGGNGEEKRTVHMVTFPPESSGARILGPIRKSAEVRETNEKHRQIAAKVFDQFAFSDNRRRGGKQLTQMIKGPHLMDYYLDKHGDQLMVNLEAQEKHAEMRHMNVMGFKRRRPQPKGAKAKAKGKDTRRK
jgi:hypothetical protein